MIRRLLARLRKREHRPGPRHWPRSRIKPMGEGSLFARLLAVNHFIPAMSRQRMWRFK